MEPGTHVRVEMTKWGDRPHWQFEGVRLGSDKHGEWLGTPAGTHHHRPGYEFHSEVDTVTLIPRDDWYAATFHRPGNWCHLYVDMTTPGTWEGDVLRMVDLDLDVIRMSPEPPADHPLATLAGPGAVFVDDEDEFAEHRVAFAYPSDVVAAAQDTCNRVLVETRARRAPYDGSHSRWLDALRQLSGRATHG